VEAFTTLATRPRPGVSQLFAANDDEPSSVADDSRRNVFRTAGAALATWAIAFAGPALDAANALDKDAFSIGQSNPSKIIYDDLVLTTIDVTDVTPKDSNDKDYKVVRFTNGSGNSGTAHFLEKIKYDEKTGTYEALDVTSRFANSRNKLEKPLIAVHGFNVNPHDHLENCEQAREYSTKFRLIPFIWPTTDDISFPLSYINDKGQSENAGINLRKALEKLSNGPGGDPFGNKSLVAHSMGNRVLRYAASEKSVKFDNIFMAAADVDYPLFAKQYIDGKSWEKNETKMKHGLNIANMLRTDQQGRPVGKIYTLYTESDVALFLSQFLNAFYIPFQFLKKPRLGAKGAEYEGSKYDLHPDLQGKVESKKKDWRRPLPWEYFPDFLLNHSYHLDKEAIAFYESKSVSD
jgi:hypothetical protein